MSYITILKKLSITMAGSVATIGVLASSSHAATLGIYTLDNTLSASSVNSNLIFSNFSYTGTATPTFVIDNNTPVGQAYSASKWSTNSNLTNYFSFTITPKAGYNMTLDSIKLDEQRSATGIRNWQIRSSLDNYATSIATFNLLDNTTWRSDQTTNLNSLFSNLNSAVQFRIYGYNSESTSGTWRVDDVKVNGSVLSVATIPEPRTILGLLTVTGLTVAMKRQKSNS